MLQGERPILLVGAGRMGGAMLQRWLERGLSAARVTVLDPELPPDRHDALAEAGVRVVASPTEVGGRAYAFVVLAVKPQTMAAVLAGIAPLIPSDAVIVSIAAGVRLETLAAALSEGQPVIRAMPNTPAQIGTGISVAIADRHVGAAARDAADALLSAVGDVAWIDDEALIDAVTAVSGSGPAYVFLLAECLSEAAREAGLPADLADRLARQTVVGAGALLGDSPLPASELRRNVTSPGGTTAAALEVLMAPDGLQQLMTRAVEKAKRRAIELG